MKTYSHHSGLILHLLYHALLLDAGMYGKQEVLCFWLRLCSASEKCWENTGGWAVGSGPLFSQPSLVQGAKHGPRTKDHISCCLLFPHHCALQSSRDCFLLPRGTLVRVSLIFGAHPLFLSRTSLYSYLFLSLQPVHNFVTTIVSSLSSPDHCM